MRKEKAKPKESEAEGEAIQQPKPKKYPRQPKKSLLNRNKSIQQAYD
jgi:hypothetical protein